MMHTYAFKYHLKIYTSYTSDNLAKGIGTAGLTDLIWECSVNAQSLSETEISPVNALVGQDNFFHAQIIYKNYLEGTRKKHVGTSNTKEFS